MTMLTKEGRLLRKSTAQTLLEVRGAVNARAWVNMTRDNSGFWRNALEAQIALIED